MPRVVMPRVALSCIVLIGLVAFAVPAWSDGEAPASSNPHVVLETSKGSIEIELFADKAPKTVENFLHYAKSGFYDGTIFHRVIRDFMVQGGGFTADMVQKPTQDPVQNEADNGVSNARGTIAMARTGDPHSATAQFFINLVDNTFLNHTAKNRDGWGYTAFGRVVEGMDVVDAIAAVSTAPRRGHGDVPVETVTITKVSVK